MQQRHLKRLVCDALAGEVGQDAIVLVEEVLAALRVPQQLAQVPAEAQSLLSSFTAHLPALSCRGVPCTDRAGRAQQHKDALSAISHWLPKQLTS